LTAYASLSRGSWKRLLIYKQPDGDNEEDTGKRENEKKDKVKNKEDVASETEHRGFGFVMFVTDDS
jgi:hypothetical protein